MQSNFLNYNLTILRIGVIETSADYYKNDFVLLNVIHFFFF